MELLLLITICLLTGQTFGFELVKMTFKDDQDVLLPCSFTRDLSDKKVTWNKDGKDIYVLENGKVDPSKVDERFRGRISHFQDGLQSGNASIKIKNAKISEAGNYNCWFSDNGAQGGLLKIELTGYVGIREDEIAILPCHYGINLTAERFDWKKDGMDVLSYGKGIITNSSHRASYFPDEIQSGNASIKIEKAKVSDSGNYVCMRINEKHKTESELHIKLVVVCKLNSSAKECDKCVNPAIETTKVEGGVQVECEALGVSTESEMKLKNSADVTVDAKTAKGGNPYNITLRVVLTKEDHYHCVWKQGDICQPVNTKWVYVPSGAGYFLVPSSLLVFSLSLSLGF